MAPIDDLASCEIVRWHQTTFGRAGKSVTPEASALRPNIAVSVPFVAQGKVERGGYTSRTEVSSQHQRKCHQRHAALGVFGHPMGMIDSWAFRAEAFGGVEKPEDDFGITITVPVLLASAIHGFDGAMKRRTFHLPPNLDRALAKHADAQGKKPSVVVRDALAIYLVIEDTHHRVSTTLDALRQEMRAGLLSIQELITREPSGPQRINTPASTDRVRARFDLINRKDEAHENGNR